MTIEATVTRVEDKRFVGQSSSGHAIVVDGSAEKTAMAPMELVLVGMAGCTPYDMVVILSKKRQSVTGLDVSARGERAAEPPRVYTAIDIEYVVHGRGVRPKTVEDAIRLSKEKYCSASIMLGKTAAITTRFRIVEEGSG